MIDVLQGFSREYYFTPVLANVMKSRNLSGAIILFSLLHFAAMLVGLDGLWQCPIYAATYVPCPGCYLGRAIASLLHGNVLQALDLHFFAPFILAGVVLIGVSACLPDKPRQTFIAAVEGVELRTGFSAAVLYGLMLYWLLRLFWIGFPA